MLWGSVIYTSSNVSICFPYTPVVLSVMLGSAFTECQQSAEFRRLVQQFSAVVYDIFRCSSELMNIPPAIADRLNVQPWQQFEKVVPETIRLGKHELEQQQRQHSYPLVCENNY